MFTLNQKYFTDLRRNWWVFNDNKIVISKLKLKICFLSEDYEAEKDEGQAIGNDVHTRKYILGDSSSEVDEESEDNEAYEVSEFSDDYETSEIDESEDDEVVGSLISQFRSQSLETRRKQRWEHFFNKYSKWYYTPNSYFLNKL